MSQPLRIAFVLQDTGSLYGAERATLDLAVALRRRGDDAGVILLRETRLGAGFPSLAGTFLSSGVPTEAVPVDRAFSLSAVHCLRKKLDASQPTALYTVGYKAGIHAGWASDWGRRLPWVCVVHGWLNRRDFKERFYGWLDVRSMRRASAVVVLSRFYQDTLSRLLPPSRIHLIPTGLPDAFFALEPTPADSPSPDGELVVGTLGRLSEEKNQAALIEAAALCQDLPIRMLIGGEGGLRESLVEQARALGIMDRVELPGFMGREAFLERCDIFVLCSRIENRPYSIMEAMAAGKPVVATAVGGIPELVEDGVTGLLVDSTPVSLAAALRRLAEDPAIRRRMGEAARAKAERDFRIDSSARTHQALIRHLACA